MFFAIIGAMIAGDLLLWWWADRLLRGTRREKLWRWLVGGHNVSQVALLIFWLISRRTFVVVGDWFWVPVSAWIYVWHLFVLPGAVVAILLGFVVQGMIRLARGSVKPEDMKHEVGAQAIVPQTSRREFLGTAVAIAPQIALAGTLGFSARQLGSFRVRKMELAFAGLPAALDGVTIAHISDTHVGRFVREKHLEEIVEATAALRPDAIAFTGDLIDFALADLPKAIRAMQQMQKIAPTALCVGNHDLFESPRQFRARVRDAGLPLLLNESLAVPIRGETLELLGIDWGFPGSGRDAAFVSHVRRLEDVRKTNVFSVLLAHHPHAFDPAAAAKIPLTLAGHTHGGQLMLTENIGPGPMAFKYWSGLYEKAAGQKLVVSNGVGNWFPLRINAPAEIVQVTLRKE